MINRTKLIFALISLTLMISCGTSHKRVAYLQDSKGFNILEVSDSMFDARIMPKDLITIAVSTTDPEASIPFNLTVPTVISQNSSKYLTSQPTMQQYLVENDGTINFPVLGTLNLKGLTKKGAETLIKSKLIKYLKEEPIVNVRMTNFKISVLGEVHRPGSFVVTNEKINILEALAMAGDLTIYGKRDNIKLIRERSDGGKLIVELNLNKSDIITSPYYYLRQNDVLYVTPNETYSKDSNISQSKTIWISITSTLVSVATLVLSVINIASK